MNSIAFNINSIRRALNASTVYQMHPILGIADAINSSKSDSCWHDSLFFHNKTLFCWKSSREVNNLSSAHGNHLARPPIIQKNPPSAPPLLWRRFFRVCVCVCVQPRRRLYKWPCARSVDLSPSPSVPRIYPWSATGSSSSIPRSRYLILCMAFCQSHSGFQLPDACVWVCVCMCARHWVFLKGQQPFCVGWESRWGLGCWCDFSFYF